MATSAAMSLIFLVNLFRFSSAEEPDCSLFAVATFPKYLDCPLVNATELISTTTAVDYPIVNVSWTIVNAENFIFHFKSFSIDYFGVHDNTNLSFTNYFNVTSSGQLFISRISRDMRLFDFECAVFNKSTSQWSQQQRLGRLNVLWYDPYLDTSLPIPEGTLRKPNETEIATIGLNKFVCIQGEAINAQIEWIRSNSLVVNNSVNLNESDLQIIDNKNGLEIACFECKCIVTFLTRYLDHLVDNNDKYISFTATGYHLPNTYDLFEKALQCSGIPNWFLSVLMIRNVSNSDTDDYQVTVHSNSVLKYTSRFSLLTGYAQIIPRFTTTKLNGESVKHFICKATMPVYCSLAWLKTDGTKVKTITSSSEAYNVNDLCHVHASNTDAVSLTMNDDIVSTSYGSVRIQRMSLIVCKEISTTASDFQCVAQSRIKNGETAYYGPHVSIHKTTSDPQPSTLYTKLISGSASVACVLLSALLIIIIAYHCFKATHKQQQNGRFERPPVDNNVYFDDPCSVKKE